MFDLEGMADAAFGNTLYEDIQKAVLFKIDNVWGVISGVYSGTILPIGYALLCLYFLIELIEKTTRENLNFEHFIRLFIKLIIGKMLMDNAINLFSYFISFGNVLVNSLTQNVSHDVTSTVDMVAIKESIKGLNAFESIAIWAKLIVPQLVAWIISGIANVVCWSRSIELVARMCLAPIAMPDIFGEGTRGNGFRYLRKILAISLQGAIILVIAIAMNQLNVEFISQILKNEGAITDVKDIPFRFFIISASMGFTTVTLIQKSREWANDVIGV